MHILFRILTRKEGKDMGKKIVGVDSEFVDDPNGQVITSFILQEYPQICDETRESTVENIVEEMIGSRQVRLAGRPTPESEVAMRKVVRSCVENKCPIPVLVVSGPKKTVVGESVDLAELSALKMLACLDKRVKAFFAPGITVRIRLEDTTGYYLEEGVEGLHETIERYVNDFSVLVRVLGYGDFIEPVRERILMTESQLREAAGEVFPLLLSYLQDSEHLEESEWGKLGSWKRLSDTGWQGMIPREMRQHYHGRYSRLFPGCGEEDILRLIAKYMAGTLARYQLRATGAIDSWPGFFQINFAPPVPGIPKSLVSTRLYYRTVPLCHTKRHMPFWRAKGIMKLNGSVRLSLVSWGEKLDINPFVLTFSDGAESVNVRSDYVLVD